MPRIGVQHVGLGALRSHHWLWRTIDALEFRLVRRQGELKGTGMLDRRHAGVRRYCGRLGNARGDPGDRKCNCGGA